MAESEAAKRAMELQQQKAREQAARDRRNQKLDTALGNRGNADNPRHKR